ncbi:MAG TPA: nucleotidyltransferase family protein [bacterium]|nr:nucleotidyltransferase family protein [bacterium]HPN29797.1 nucleotidyltransferase family protein [bacterium]
MNQQIDEGNNLSFLLPVIYFFKNAADLSNSGKLVKLHKTNYFRNIYILGELKKISLECVKYKIEPPVLLKGSAYIFKLYSDDFGYRILSDIDLVVFDDWHKEKILKIIGDLGYGRGSKYEETYTNGKIKIDIHSELINSNRIGWRRGLFSNMNLKKNSVKKEIDGVQYNFLSDNADFIYCLFHNAVHHGFKNIKWILDAFAFIKKKLVNPDEIFAEIQSLNLIDEFRFVLSCMDYNLPLDLEWKNKFQIPYKKKIIVRLFSANVLEINYCQYAFNYYLMKKNERLGYVMTLLFPSKKILELKYSGKNILAAYAAHFIEIIKSAGKFCFVFSNASGK